ncbi:MAG: sigma-54-dependent Fis family transcriptional regulator, partial [Planctomycetes bacterium]|nr:sigma-54-dependent Fis family transcriptional regulator [Planctomycetota bacterium]
IQQRRFREDLYYRLRVFTLAIPPLRERVEDVLPLARMFLEQERHSTKRFTPRAQRLLETYSWPGNVRELANVVKHGAVLSRGEPIDVPHLPEELLHPAHPSAPSLMTLAEAEREHIRRVLEACGGRQIEAAHILGIDRTTLWRKLKSLA